jgi:L-ascorbate metabolism protein UlaG (beta-lactamase superfamily)
MQVIYHGHSFVEIETEKGHILIDPFVTGNPKCDLSLEQLFFKKITHIFLTHGHEHHIGDTLLIAKQFPDAVVVGESELMSILIQQGVTKTYAMAV